MILSIVIATYNRKKFLCVLMDQLQKQVENPFEFLIIVVDDGSTDGTSELLHSDYPEVYVIKGNGNWWWTKCMNEGFKRAVEIGSDFVLIMNDDNEIKPNYLWQLWKDYITLPSNSILGSMSVSIEQEDAIEMSGTKSFNRILLKSKPYHSRYTLINESVKGIYPTCTLSGRGTFIPCNLFKQIGFFEEKLLQYGSDDEFILRARKNKIGTYVSWNSRVLNHTYLTSGSSSVKKSSLKNFTLSFFKDHTSNSIKKEMFLYRKYGVKILLPFFVSYFILGAYKSYFFNFRKIKKADHIV